MSPEEVSDHLAIARGSLRCAQATDTEALVQLVSKAWPDAINRGPGPLGGAMRVTRPSEKEAYAVHVSPLHVAGREPMERHRALKLVIDPTWPATASEEVVQVLFGLTPAESQVALGLFHGKGVRSLASQMGVTENTMRTHIRRILDKTDTNRQGELVSVLARRLAPIEN